MEKENKKLKITNKINNWFYDYADYMADKNPNSHDAFLDKNPFPKD